MKVVFHGMLCGLLLCCGACSDSGDGGASGAGGGTASTNTSATTTASGSASSSAGATSGSATSASASSATGGSQCTSDCATFPNAAPVHNETCVSAAFPVPQGGPPPASGTYYRTASEQYDGSSCDPGDVHQETLVVCDSQTVQLVNNVDFTSGMGATVSFDGATMTLSLACPAEAAATLGYEATPQGFKIFDAAQGRVNVYEIAPQ